ncbi:MAG: leucine-rich repeat protein, partial [Clostridiales bacterium]|nr:leucine-rich repeat protein [Clostridiales bacterium]
MQKKLYKLLSVIMAAVMVLAVAPVINIGSVTASAASYSGSLGSNVSWSYDSSTKKITVTGTGSIKDYSSADNGQGWQNYRAALVTTIAKHATSVVIGEGITSIGNNAFRSLTKITSVSIPSTVTSIGTSAFQGCSALTTVNLPDGLTTIGANAFNGTKFASVDMPYSVTSIGSNAFANISSLKITCNYGDAAYTYCQSNSVTANVRTPSLAVSSSYVTSSKQMTVSIYLKDASGFNAGNFTLTYDSSYMTPVSSGSSTSTTDNMTVGIVYNSAGKISVAAMVPDVVEYASCDKDDECSYKIADIVFNVTGSSNDSTVSLSCSVMQFTDSSITAPSALTDATVSKHNWDNGTVTTAATCSSTGVRTYTCKDCGETKTETIAKDSSNHAGGTKIANASDATCVSAGYTGDTVCLGCGATISVGSEIAATGVHTYGSWTVTTAATCTDGEQTRTCSVCGATETETIAA